MSGELSRLLERMAGSRVLVIGEAILDSYLEGTAGRLCREAPVPIVNLSRRRDVPGGAANTAVNARTLGGEVAFLSVIGDDPDGLLLRRALETHGVPTDHLVVERARDTLTKNRVVADSQILLRFDRGATLGIDGQTESRLLDRLRELWPGIGAVVVSDYSYGVVTPGVLQALGELQAADPRVLVVDARDAARYRDLGVTAVKPNYREVVDLLGPEPNGSPGRPRAELIEEAAERLLDETGARIAAVTLDTDGAVVLERGRDPYRTYATPQPNSTAMGAGDTFTAALALALVAGADPPVAGELASMAAQIVVGKEGTTPCRAEELREAFLDSEAYVPDVAGLEPRLRFYREQGYRIVFTNGCFDILHRGHSTYLNAAKALGDVLIVGLNSDASTRRLKGPGRPINPLEDRAEVLSALSCIDHIVAFDEDTPDRLIRAIRPDVFVKGGDYTRERLPEANLVEELGGRVEILPYVEDRSTTGIIRRIRETQRRPPRRRGGDAPATIPSRRPPEPWHGSTS